MTRHFLRDDDVTHAEQAELLDRAVALKADPLGNQPLAGPLAVALVFDKASTRTRLSFSVGVSQLGGTPVVIDGGTSQLGRGESVLDTTRILDRQCAAIVWRTFGQQRLEQAVSVSSVPVVNSLTDEFHPCQVLADLLTIREHKDRLSGLTLTYAGDGANNMAHSYLLGGALAGLNVRIAAPDGHQPDLDVVQRARELAHGSGGSVLVTDDTDVAFDSADVVATDTWVSMGQEEQSSQRTGAQSLFGPFAVDAAAMAKAAPDAIVLHCLPAYRGVEIAAEVIDGPQSVVWDQAENRLHAQKALLTWLVEQS
ncbi:MAG TPA: ornithine carbamoyltransferase [Segeticoccus sp.]|nr:ornithine carbamoyltransferase [Segeticoccus sp.]